MELPAVPAPKTKKRVKGFGNEPDYSEAEIEEQAQELAQKIITKLDCYPNCKLLAIGTAPAGSKAIEAVKKHFEANGWKDRVEWFRDNGGEMMLRFVRE